MNKPENWWEYLDWKEMGVVLTHYAIWPDEAKEFVKKSLGCEDCYGWSPDICENSCPHTHPDAKDWVEVQSSSGRTIK